MDNKDYELTNEELLEQARESYISKIQLIEMINALDFEKVKDFRMEVITNFNIKYTDENKRYVNTFGYDIHIN